MTETANHAAALHYVSEHPCQFLPGFYKWLDTNGPLWEEFERRALWVARRRERFSARAIMHIIRWDTVMREQGGDFKINNNNSADMSRLFMKLHPESGVFQIRETRQRKEMEQEAA